MPQTKLHLLLQVQLDGGSGGREAQGKQVSEGGVVVLEQDSIICTNIPDG